MTAGLGVLVQYVVTCDVDIHADLQWVTEARNVLKLCWGFVEELGLARGTAVWYGWVACGDGFGRKGFEGWAVLESGLAEEIPRGSTVEMFGC